MFLYWQKKPHETLTPYVKTYWHFRRNFKASTKQVIYPDSFYELIWVKRGQLRVNGIVAPEIFFGGFNNTPITLTGNGDTEIYAVRFYAWGCVPFTDVMFAKDGLFVDIDKVLSPVHATSLREHLHAEASGFYKTMDEFLVALLAEGHSIASAAELFDVLSHPDRSLNVRNLAEHFNLSNRQLERNIRKATGATPGEILKRIRFERVRKALLDKQYRNLSEIAHEHGYTDQSHLSREFRQFTNMTPLQFQKEFHRNHHHLQKDGKWEWDQG